MPFNDTAIKELEGILRRYNIFLSDRGAGWITFSSYKVEIRLVHCKMDKQNDIFVGATATKLCHLSDYIIKAVFNSDIKISNLPPDTFIDTLITFFENEGSILLTEDSNTLDAVQKYLFIESREYNKQLIKRQNLKLADDAWEKENYFEFTKYIDKIGLAELPGSYQLKYRMANKRNNV